MEAKIHVSLTSSVFTCGICFEYFDSDKHVPKLYRCGHYACASCVEKLYSTSPQPTASSSSPLCHICRNTISCSQSTLPNHFLLMEIIENAKKTNRCGSLSPSSNTNSESNNNNNNNNSDDKVVCDECDEIAIVGCMSCSPPLSLCQGHYQDHLKSKRTNSHTPLPLPDFVKAKQDKLASSSSAASASSTSTTVPTCPQHSSMNFEYYCLECERCICLRCVAVNCHKHDRIDLIQAYHTFKSNIDTLISESHSKLSDLERYMEALTLQTETVSKDAKKTISLISHTFDEYRRELSVRELSLIDNVKSLEMNKIKILHSQLESVQFLYTSLDSLNTHTSKLSQCNPDDDPNMSYVHFLNHKSTLIANIKKELENISELNLSENHSNQETIQFVADDKIQNLISNACRVTDQHLSPSEHLTATGEDNDHENTNEHTHSTPAAESDSDTNDGTSNSLFFAPSLLSSPFSSSSSSSSSSKEKVCIPSTASASQLVESALSYESHNEWLCGIRLWERAAQLGHPLALFRMGNRYSWGWCRRYDNTKAVEYWLRAANAGHMGGIALCHRRGVAGYAKDHIRAFKMMMEFSASVHGNDADALYYLGVFFEHGYGTAKSMTKAMQFYGEAALKNHAQAQWALGVFYENGDGVKQDDRHAFELYMYAAKQEHSSAYFSVAKCFEKGTGVVASREAAIGWYKKAEALGNPMATDALNRLGPSARCPIASFLHDKIGLQNVCKSKFELKP